MREGKKKRRERQHKGGEKEKRVGLAGQKRDGHFPQAGGLRIWNRKTKIPEYVKWPGKKAKKGGVETKGRPEPETSIQNFFIKP